jgi:D-3-phosphoglycerate dehydrogenase / 2-oxoglutarate reductase
MKSLMIILDDWEGRIAASACWKKVKESVDIRFLNGADFKNNAPMDTALFENVSIIMALRERTTIDEKFLMHFPKLQLILQTGGHAYHIDLDAAKSRRVAIILGRSVKAPLASVPELTMAMMLNLFHKIIPAHQAIRSGEWPLVTGRTLAGKRLGILGMGRHGSRVAAIARNAFAMDVVAWERKEVKTENPDGYPRLFLEELLSTSDVVSIHLRLSKESAGLINAEKLALMKPDAILINTARGAIVDERALINALQHEQLAGAGLDVFEQEPLPIESPLRSMENVVLTPHLGWTVEEVFEEFAQIACTQLQAWLNGELFVSGS